EKGPYRVLGARTSTVGTATCFSSAVTLLCCEKSIENSKGNSLLVDANALAAEAYNLHCRNKSAKIFSSSPRRESSNLCSLTSSVSKTARCERTVWDKADNGS